MLIMVTGSSGKIGRIATKAIRAAGHRVVELDLNVPTDRGRAVRCDCTDFGQVMAAFSGVDATSGVPDAVVHLAGIPMPGLATDHVTFDVNIRATYNVMSACARLGIKRLVWASSETILGLPFDGIPPDFAPVDESHPDRPGWSYALSKQMGEAMAESFVRWHPEMTILSLRFSNVFSLEDYAGLAKIQARPDWRRFNLWSYVDAEDAGDACRLALTADLTGHHRMIIAAADSLLETPSTTLMQDAFPDVPIRSSLEGCESLLSSAAAERLIGYRPRYSWRDRTCAAPPSGV